MDNKTPEEQQKEMDVRVANFDKEFRALQEKYKLRVIAQILFPSGGGRPAILDVPIQVAPIMPLNPPAVPKAEVVKPE